MEVNEPASPSEVVQASSRIPKPRHSSAAGEQVTPGRTSSKLLQPGFLQTAATRATTAAAGKLSGDCLKHQEVGSHSCISLSSNKQRSLVTTREARLSGRSQGSRFPVLKNSPSASASSGHTGASEATIGPDLIKAAWDEMPAGAKPSAAEQHRQPVKVALQQKLNPLSISPQGPHTKAAVADSTSESPISALRREFQASTNLGVEIGGLMIEEADTTPENWLQPERPFPLRNKSANPAWVERSTPPPTSKHSVQGTELWIRDHCSVSSPDILLPEHTQRKSDILQSREGSCGRSSNLEASSAQQGKNSLPEASADQDGASHVEEGDAAWPCQELHQLESLQKTLHQLRIVDASSEVFLTLKRVSSASSLSEDKVFFSASSKLEMEIGSPKSPVSHRIDMESEVSASEQ